MQAAVVLRRLVYLALPGLPGRGGKGKGGGAEAQSSIMKIYSDAQIICAQ